MTKMTMTEYNHPLYKAITKRIQSKKQNVLILIVGDPGTGKSFLALRLASMLDPTFNEETMRERVVCHAEQFSNLIANGDDDKLNEGAAFIVDEMGASMGNRDWYTIGNKSVSVILQTFRYRRLIMIMTVPNMSFIDVHARKLINFLIETKKIDFASKKVKARVWKIKFNKVRGDNDPYRIRFRQQDEFGETIILDSMWFSRVDIKLAHAYEKYSHEFKQNIVEKAMKQINKMNDAGKKKEFDASVIVEKIMNDKDSYFKSNGRLDRGKVENDFHIGANRYRKVHSLVNETLSNIVRERSKDTVYIKDT